MWLPWPVFGIFMMGGAPGPWEHLGSTYHEARPFRSVLAGCRLCCRAPFRVADVPERVRAWGDDCVGLAWPMLDTALMGADPLVCVVPELVVAKAMRGPE